MTFDVRAFVHAHRKSLSVGLILLALYALGGFFLAPWLVERQLVGFFRDTLGLDASVEEVRTNPFTLTLDLRGFGLRESSGDNLLGFEQLRVNFQLSSLLRWAWTFKQVRLTGPRIDLTVYPGGRVNLEALVPETTEPEPSAEPGQIPRLIVHELSVVDGSVQFEDRTRPTPFLTALGPTSFSLTRFSTLPQEQGELAFEAAGESGSRFTWRGTIGVNPPRSEGQVVVVNAPMPLTKRYLQDRLRFQLLDGRVDAQFDYRAALENQQVQLALQEGSVVVRQLVVADEAGDTELLRLPELRVERIGLEWPQRTLSIADVVLTGARLAVWRTADGAINLLEPLVRLEEDRDRAVPDGAAEAGTKGGIADDWRLSLDRLALEDAAVAVEDRGVDPPFRTGVASVRLEVGGIDNLPGSSFAFSAGADVETGGSASAEGKVGMLPRPVLDAAVKVDGLSLTPLQSYLEEVARLRIDSGAVSVDGRLTSGDDERMAYRGTVALVDLACHDVRRDERLVGVGRMTADDLLLELTGARLRVSSVDLARPYGRLTIYEDGTTNVGDALGLPPAGEAPTGGAGAGEPPSDSPPMAIEIGEVRIHDGSADFADLSLPLPFASHIDALEGGISEMSSGGTSASVKLGGTVDEYGLARIEGNLDMFAPDRRSDVSVAFRNVEMSRLSPYSTKFAGYAVESGRLSLDLRYRLEDRRLESENKILIDQLTLGEKVESPDAPHLPVRLAVAMLKDKNGRIDLDIPVGGTLDDPEFSYGKVVWKAIKNVITKIATAPFRALARLVGSNKDLEFVEFAAADSQISPPSRETLDSLAKALAERPELTLDVRGIFDPQIDAPAIRSRKIEMLVAERSASAPQPTGHEPVLASEQRRAALESLFLERFPREDLAALVASHGTAPSADTGSDGQTAQPVLDLARYLDAVEERIGSTIEVTDVELARLADERGAAIRDTLTAGGQVPIQRVREIEPGPIKKGDAGNNWVRLRLVLRSGGGQEDASPSDTDPS